MELIAACLLLTLTYIPASLGRTLTTEHHITATMNHQPTMVCKYDFKGMKSDWLIIRWSRFINETKKVQLAVLQKGVLASEWSETAPEDFRDHVEPLNNVGATSVSFDMRIDGFRCSDAGKYVCEVITLSGDYASTTEMEIKVNPEIPSIQEDIIQVNENETFTMRCHGNVGIPATTLRWSYMLKGRNIYQLVDTGVTQENSPTRNCMLKGTSSLELTMTPQYDGAAFVCYTGVDIEPDDTRKFAQVILELPGKSTKPPSTTTEAPCTGDNCVNVYASVDNGAESRCVQFAATTLLGSLLMSLFIARTS